MSEQRSLEASGLADLRPRQTDGPATPWPNIDRRTWPVDITDDVISCDVSAADWPAWTDLPLGLAINGPLASEAGDN